MNRRLCWIHHDEAQARRAIRVPLCIQALQVLESERSKHGEFVFTFRGQPIQQATTKARHAALERAEIEDFRFHDLRHTWASWHVQRGTPVYELQKLGGWESATMVERYAHLSSNHLSERVDRFFASQLQLPRYDLEPLIQPLRRRDGDRFGPTQGTSDALYWTYRRSE